jgi:hypothetical protein
MFYELKVKVDKENKKGEIKPVTELFITDCELFANAEYTGLNEYDGKCDVVAIKRSAIREIVNTKEEGKPFFRAAIVQIYTNDDGTEKELLYPVLVCASDMKEANKLMEDYIKQGLNDMKLKEIKESKILDVL